MSQDVKRLEELLARVQKNAAEPRVWRAAVHVAPDAPPMQAAPAPVAYSPPAPVFVALAPVSSPPPPVAYSPPAPAYSPPAAEYSPPQPTFMDSVDDLLADPFPASSAPPPPPAQSRLEEEAPLPTVASPSEHISGVMPVAEVVEEPPEELLEDDIVEMSPTALAAEAVVPGVRPAVDDVDLNFDDEDEAAPDTGQAEEEPPASSSRNRIAGTMDEALARAAEQMEMQEGREVPLKTPPPESGPQEAMAPLPSGIHAPPAPELDELLEADILPVAAINAAVPTTEQLGQTIDLDEARGPHLELDQPAPGAASLAEAPTEELEITLPQREFGGGYQDDLMPPPEARRDLDAHLQRVGDDAIAPAPESLGQYPSAIPAERVSGTFAAVTLPSVTTESPAEAVSMVTIEAPANAEFSPELLARPEIGPGPVAKFIRAETQRPSTFLELLDASIALGRD